MTPTFQPSIYLVGQHILLDASFYMAWPSNVSKFTQLFYLQEDLTVTDTNEILDDLIAGKKPIPGPRWANFLRYKYDWHQVVIGCHLQSLSANDACLKHDLREVLKRVVMIVIDTKGIS